MPADGPKVSRVPLSRPIETATFGIGTKPFGPRVPLAGSQRSRLSSVATSVPAGLISSAATLALASSRR
jgi:hypothetical protein